MTVPHLRAALIPTLLVALLLAVFPPYAEEIEARYIHVLAPEMFQQKNQGSALQRQALREADLLLLYGSSELLLPDRFSASTLFARYPTGFMVCPIGDLATQPLIMLQKLAPLAAELRGKKIAISLSTAFFMETLGEESYAGNFSPLHANALAFSTDLSAELKHAAAQRMLQYPATLEEDRLLRWALNALADGSPAAQLAYAVLFPLGRARLFILDLQDHWATLAYIFSRSNLKVQVSREDHPLNWAELKTRAEQEYIKRANNNPFGIQNEDWDQAGENVIKAKGTLPDDKFLRLLRISKGWGDLDLLLREIKETGAVPLILSMPLHGLFYEHLGVSPPARAVFYDRLENAVGPYGFPLVDFRDHDTDKFFLTNPLSHLSSKGWVYYDQALDDFYHDRIP